MIVHKPTSEKSPETISAKSSNFVSSIARIADADRYLLHVVTTMVKWCIGAQKLIK
jgi:hypothetical protein